MGLLLRDTVKAPALTGAHSTARPSPPATDSQWPRRRPRTLTLGPLPAPPRTSTLAYDVNPPEQRTRSDASSINVPPTLSPRSCPRHLWHCRTADIVGTNRFRGAEAATEADLSSVPSHGKLPTARRRPGQTVSCGWCGTDVSVPARGRVPKWCSNSCRHRAWEQRRAADSGLAAVEVVDRPVEVMVEKKTVVERRVTVPVRQSPHSRREWIDVLDRLTWALSTNRMDIADLGALEPALSRVLISFSDRSTKLHRRRPT